jgi:hypothetical protein
MRMTRTAAMAAVLAVASVGAASAAEDDLAVVKRAVARQEVKAADPAVRAEPPAARKASELKWLKVRVTEKGTRRAKVTINLPIALVRALGDDYPIDFGRRRWDDASRERVRLGEVLEALEAGSPLVEIDDEDALVRVWVE